MSSLEERMAAQLAALDKLGNLRQLRDVEPEGLYLNYQGRRYLNLSSNDYLGLSALEWASEPQSSFLHGSPSSRLMTGNGAAYALVEKAINDLFVGRESLVLPCGYMANSGILPAITQKDDLILADKLAHASMIDGLRLCEAPFKRFRHNDVEHLEKLLQEAQGRTVWVLVESIYSMDGDYAPLAEIIALKNKYDFHLYVDEAHSFGVLGPHGAGLCAQLGMLDEVDILVCTFGKAIAGAGACVICSPLMRKYLINTMRTLIFTTAMPPTTLLWVAQTLTYMRSDEIMPSGLRMSELRSRLAGHIQKFTRLTGVPAQSQIIPLHAGSNEQALTMAQHGMNAGYWLTAIRPPTVPQGAARIRLSLSAAFSEEEIQQFAHLCNKLG